MLLTALALTIAAAFADPTVMVAEQEMGYGDIIEVTSYMLDADGKPIVRREMTPDETTAAMLAILAKAPDQSLWHPIYLEMRMDPARIPFFAQELTAAIHEMSALEAAKQDDDRAWIVANVVKGTTRAHAVSLLHTRGLHLNNGGTLSLPGAFEPGCYWHKDITIAFDARNRVAKVSVSKPIPECL